MNVRIDKSFAKDTDKIKDQSLKGRIADVIGLVQQAKSIQEITNLKKLKGEQQYYRIKLGDYRIGIKVDNDTVDFIRFLHRKDIYRYFP